MKFSSLILSSIAAATLLIGGGASAASSVVTPVSAVASSTHFTVNVNSLIDGSGLTGDLHGGEWSTMWIKEGTFPVDTTAQVTFDLGATVDLSGALIWQYNSDIDYNRGVKDFYIKTSTDGINFSAAGGLQTLERSNGGNIAAQLKTFSAQARFVQFDIQTNYDAQWPWVGLSEVKFVTSPVPEPSTYALMALGLAGVAAFARRNRVRRSH